MATTTQFLYQYRWGVGAVGVVAVIMGALWLTNRPIATAPLPVAEPAEIAVVEPPAEGPVVGVEAAVAAEAIETAVEAETAVDEVAAAETAVNEVAAVETALDEVAAAETALDEVAAAETASDPAEVAETVEPEIIVAEPDLAATAESTEILAETEAVPVSDPVAEPAAEPVVAPAAKPAAEPVEAAAVAAAVPDIEVATATEEPGGAEPAAEAPTLDLVRVEPDGSAVIAGQAEPNSEVEITVDGEVVATTTATETGEFVAFVETATEPGTQAIQAVAADESGADLVSADIVLVLTPVAPEGETAAPAVVSATAQAITVLQPGGLAIPDQVSLDTISYDQAGEAILAGRAQPLSEVRIYVDDIFAVSGKAAESGAWQMRLDQVAAGRYILRVDEIGPDGAVTSRAETPFQKEYPENIAPFLQMANGKLTVQPGNNLWVMAREIYGSGIEYTQIFAANKDKIRDPDLIFPGQIFDIPEN